MEKKKINDNKVSIHPQCQYFVLRKKRLCRMTVRPGRNYCGEHEPQPRTEKGKDDTRIPCPYDPKHTCYASKLLKHLAICNARKGETPAYIVCGINAPTLPCLPRVPLSQIPRHKIMTLINKVNILYDKYVKDTISTLEEQPIHSAVAAEFLEAGRTESSLRHLRQASNLLHLIEAEGLVQDGTCYVELGAGKGHLSYYAYKAWCGDNRSRVLLVDRASLRHKRDNKLRAPRVHTAASDTTGSATSASASLESAISASSSLETANPASDSLESAISASSSLETAIPASNSLDSAIPASSSLESASASDSLESAIPASDSLESGMPASQNADVASVADSNESTAALNTTSDSASGCSRIRADLAHLALDKVPEVAQCDAVVGFAKHLCGVATDYALRCVARAGAGQRARGLALATCCHHRCEPSGYVAMRHLQEMGINEEELNIMLGIVSWATCGDGRSRERRLTADSGDVDTEQIVPRRVKRDGHREEDINMGNANEEDGAGNCLTGDGEANVTRSTSQNENELKGEETGASGLLLDRQERDGGDEEDTERILAKRVKRDKGHREQNANMENANEETNMTRLTFEGENNTSVEYEGEGKVTGDKVETGASGLLDREERAHVERCLSYQIETGASGLLDLEERARVGRRAKALLDYGRVRWLSERELRARLVRYVPRAVTLEDVCIVARADQPAA